MRRALVLFSIVLATGCPDDDSDTDTVDTDTDTDSDTEAPIEAGTETVTATWDVELFDPTFESPTIARFDTLDGRRQLDKMTIAVDHTAVMTMNVENASAFALEEGDFRHELYLNSIIQLGTADEEPPFFGPGSFMGVQELALAAPDGVEGSGDDFHQDVVTDTIEASFDFDGSEETAHFLEAMTGTEDVQLVVGGFSESFVAWDEEIVDGLVYAGASSIGYSGTITITYEYSPTEE